VTAFLRTAGPGDLTGGPRSPVMDRGGRAGWKWPGSLFIPLRLAGGLFVGDVLDRCAGFLATGGAGLPLFCCDICDICDICDVCDAADVGRMGGGNVCVDDRVDPPVGRRGGGGGGGDEDSSSVGTRPTLSSPSPILPTLAGRLDGSYAGGSFRPMAPVVEAEYALGKLTDSYGELEMLVSEATDDDRGTEIQSGSSVWPKGLAGRLGLRAMG
jgi:hypothetical protein